MSSPTQRNGSSPPELMVVLPVFNEENSIEQVIREWFAILDSCVGDFVLLAIDDGSRDGTSGILSRLGTELGSRMEMIIRPNRGHGQTCLQGYRIAAERDIPYILQIDSDGQCDPRFFPRFWEIRGQYEVIYGHRSREDGYKRVLASYVLKMLLKLGFGLGCVDANVPYRLMRTSHCSRHFYRIPSNFFLANVAMSALLAKDSTIRHGVVPIRFRPRIGGEPSVPFWKFAEKGVELYRQLRRLETVETQVHTKELP